MKGLVLLFWLVILIFFCWPWRLLAQMGREAMGSVESGVAMDGIWMYKVNPAGIAESKAYSFGFTSNSRYMLKELNERSVFAGIPVNRGVIAASYKIYGAPFYRQTQAAVAYACKLGKNFSTGIKIHYNAAHYSEPSVNRHLFTFDIGIRTRVTKDTYFGINLINPEVSKRNGPAEIPVPSGFLTGLLFGISSQSSFIIDVKQLKGEKPMMKTAIKFTDRKAFSVFAGFTTNPAVVNLGVGIKYKGIKFDFSSEWHRLLGFSPSAAILYEIQSH